MLFLFLLYFIFCIFCIFFIYFYLFYLCTYLFYVLFAVVWFQIGRMLFYGVFMGTIFIHNLELDQTGITNRVAHIFFSCLFGGFIGFGMKCFFFFLFSFFLLFFFSSSRPNFIALIPMIVQERGVFYHEQASGSYRPTTYAVSPFRL
jgi:hypothetical protein